jgi:hypothetical protein
MDLLDPRLTPGGSFREQTRRFMDSQFPFDRRRQAEQAVERFEAEAEQLMQAGDFDRLPDLRDRLWKFHGEMMDPRPRPGEPKPWSAAAEFEKWTDELAARGWRGRIVEHWRMMLRPDERIRSVDYFEITTDQRRVSRSEIKAFGRTTVETNDGFFERQFATDAQVRALEGEADAVEQQREAATRPWSLNGNRDLARGIRQ